MRYTTKQNYKDLRQKYDYIIGWGAAKEEFEYRYNSSLYKLDYLIDSADYKTGKLICGCIISNPEILKNIEKNRRVLFIIYPNCEEEIETEIKQYINMYDTIISRLIVTENEWIHRSYSESNEDLRILELLHRLHIINPHYVDVGGCHPVIRNNTYMLYECGYTDGIIVEPNIEMHNLIQQYRPSNKLVTCGASGKKNENNEVLKYYMHHNTSFRGHNTFVLEYAKEQGFADNFCEIPIENINRILEKNCSRTPDLLDLDTEGMDVEILEALDTETYKIKIICCEVSGVSTKEILQEILVAKGYVHYMSVGDNVFYIREELLKMF